MRYRCPCCGYFTYSHPPEEAHGYICRVCFWENDRFAEGQDDSSDSNHGLTLTEARSNFERLGACEAAMLPYVKPPTEEEKSGRDK